MFIKTSGPDWNLSMDCECGIPLCPVCDPDFYRDLEWDLQQSFLPDDESTPF